MLLSSKLISLAWLPPSFSSSISLPLPEVLTDARLQRAGVEIGSCSPEIEDFEFFLHIVPSRSLALLHCGA